jgi:gp178|nr:MAG TPA: Protein of unknown function (DUF1642) [Caudoviricetes sp.]
MNKKELIEKIESLPSHTSITSFRPYVDKKIILGLISQLDEPEKVAIPKFVAEWYEEHKDSLEVSIFDYVYRINEKEESVFKKWFVDSTTRPFQILVNMHQFGYTVEEEKRYMIKLKGVPDGAKFLKYTKVTREWYFGARIHYNDIEISHTRKELEEAGFDWVFDCEGIEIEKVEE